MLRPPLLEAKPNILASASPISKKRMLANATSGTALESPRRIGAGFGRIERFTGRYSRSVTAGLGVLRTASRGPLGSRESAAFYARFFGPVLPVPLPFFALFFVL
jgi:hypothetical protein